MGGRAGTPFGRDIAARRSALAEAIVARQFDARPELDRRYGPSGRQKCRDDAGYHLLYLAEAVANDTPALFRDYVAWTRSLFARLGIGEADWLDHLRITKDVLAEQLDRKVARAAGRCIDFAVRGLAGVPVEPPSFIADDAPLGPLARAYLRCLLDGRRHEAVAMILDAAQSGTPVEDLYLRVLQNVQREIGRLWQLNRITVAQEHYGTAVTQQAMARLYPHVFGRDRVGRTLVATCVADELHEVGLRMVADLFELTGWDTHYLGANVPVQGVVQTVLDRRADVLAVSTTITANLHHVEELIAAVRAVPAAAAPKVLVGGYPFLIAGDLWRRVGADGFAADAREAVTVANKLVGPSGRRR
jgi:MerR family transcriptional regulator, light-induced transcriptional regulator